MRASFVPATAFVAGVFALPTSIQQRDVLPLYSKSFPVIGSTCPVPDSTKPLGGLYPVSHMLGSVITPTLDAAIGNQSVEDIDAVADQLCVSAQQDPGSGDGICQDIFGTVRDFIDAKTPLTQSQEFGCLLDLICVAHTGPSNEGTCNQLLAGADCNANRIIGVQNLECY